MKLFDWFGARRASALAEYAQASEARASIEDPRVPISDRNVFKIFGVDELSSAAATVNIESALGLPPIFCAVNFIAGTIAGLPLHLYRRNGSEKERVDSPLATILHDAVNDEWSSFDWRKYKMEQALTHGRGVSFIERNAMRRVINLWPLESEKVTIRRQDGRKFYDYQDGSRTVRYAASEIVDIPFMLRSDQLTHRSPIMSNKETIGLGISITRYGSKFFDNGGVPPFAIEGPFESPAGAQRASEQLTNAVGKAAKENRLALSIPANHKLHQLGLDAEKMQLVDVKRFIIEEIARIYSIPPVFLQDLTHGTFTNSEQQDLHLSKHLIKRWCEQIEQELNLKIFGRFNREFLFEFDLDGLLRGDFKTRMEGYARGIQTSILKPNEVRRKENLPDDPEGNHLMIQGATVRLGSQPLAPTQPTQPDPQEGNDDGS